MKSALSIFMGKRAATIIEQTGWQAAPFSTLVGASGGPKWLILSELDQVLGKELLAKAPQPITLIGSSIGTWRHACLSQPDPEAAVKRLQYAYLHQEYRSTKPSPKEVSQVAERLLGEALGAEGIQNIVQHRRLRNTVITARAKGIARGRRGAPLVAGMAAAMVANSLSRRALSQFFERVAFCHSEVNEVPFARGFNTQKVMLTEHNLVPALKASGAIPLLMQCEENILGGPLGPYWDGGIIDYHFSLERQTQSGLILYPHFLDRLTPGWFDKRLPWRTRVTPALDNLVLICPSKEFLAGLPFGKIPDRKDFQTLSPADRLTYWQTCVCESERLAAAFYTLMTGNNPLDGVQLIEAATQ